MSTMAVAASFGARSTLNPNAPLFIPAAYQRVEDFSPEWWELVKTTSWFRDHWVRQHVVEQENFIGGEEEEDVAKLLPESFDLGINDEFTNLECLDEAAFHEAFDIIEPFVYFQKQEKLKDDVRDVEALIKSLKSAKNGNAKMAVEPLKYHEKPMQYVSPKFSPRRIIQQPR